MPEKLLLVVPGDQSSALKRWATEQFCAALAVPYRCLPACKAPYLPGAIRSLIAEAGCPVLIVAFSAGVVGVAAALGADWPRRKRIQIEAVIAIDGWLVPLFHQLPVYRMSHDDFTHRTCRPFGGMNRSNFWADPAVPHLELWAAPNRTQGWQEDHRSGERTRTTALGFLAARLAEHGFL
ncbi:hypothetical protein [Gloeobacter kilaueensis]|uniref:Alpha/beta hydrolase n=1 Tax=Gloeobacter kilaueensis (strain ATCC BAA-2537 / CCAP 1431/1 / ULC 316 / JS1) TaxID=1183438 RepID=U5QIS8_GLOK1|nr:hypothetical protein [Gloeobacter kilaueensis]AGY58801.1 hypothetical protein GKIL_2555 [Gloeobacter kilaueensis JS1]